MDAMAIVDALSDATATIDHIASRNDDAALLSCRLGVALERSAIVGSVFDCKSSGSCRGDAVSSTTCVLPRLDPALPLATACRRLSFSA
jgi:hypothetical protein